LNNFSILKPVRVDTFIDDRGFLGVADLLGSCNFETQRVYYLTDVPPGKTRGAHGHKLLEQIFICLKGSFNLTVTDGHSTDTAQVLGLDIGYHLPAGVWRELSDFSQDAVCLVLASLPYEESDYIYDFDAYLKWRISN
jgi:hypothetical protein